MGDLLELLAVCCPMTGITQCDEIFFGVRSLVRPKLFMMNFEILVTSTDLAAPSVALQNLPMEFVVCLRINRCSRVFCLNLGHAGFRFSSLRNVCFCWLGRKLKYVRSERSRASGLSFSRFAPARKS